MRALASLALVLGLATFAACSFDSGGIPHASDDDAITPDTATPPDACVPVTETCDGADNDCDGMIDEDLTSGAACDGPDADLCMDDTTICDQDGNPACSTGTDTPELCGGGDEDCDGSMDEGFVLNAPCDGTDGDLCQEGVTECTADGTDTQCNDLTDTIVETCNHADDDCDTSTDEGFDFTSDEQNCGDCGVVCQQTNSTNTCQSPGVCTPVCTNGAANCDGNGNDGCEIVDTDPACVFAAAPDITVNGDAASSGSANGTTERFLKIHIVESVTGTSMPLMARIALTSGSGTDFDLFVYCPFNCAGTPMSDPTDIIDVGRDDAAGDRSYDVIAEVRYDPTTPSTTCAQWTLTVTGNFTTTNRCGN